MSEAPGRCSYTLVELDAIAELSKQYRLLPKQRIVSELTRAVQCGHEW